MAIDVVVIGAGAAGLAAATRLGALGLAARVVEAAGWIGGRARTDNHSFGTPFDLGCHWLHAAGLNPLRVQADRLGFRYGLHGQPVRHCRGGRLLDAADQAACDAHVASGLDRLAEAGRAGQDVAAADLVDGAHRWHRALAATFTAMQGVPPRQGSTLDFARYVREGDDLPVPDGLGNLIAALGRGLAVELGTPVRRLDLRPARGIRVETVKGTLEARCAILTVSTGVLRSGALGFAPALPRWKEDAIAALPMGSCNKVALSLDRPVADGLGACVLLPLDRDGEAVEIVLQPGGAGLVVGLYNGPHGAAIADAGVDAMAEDLLDRLDRLFGSRVRAAAGAVRIMADWDREPFVRGYVSAPLPGRAEARRALAEPVDGRLFFAGEATSPDFMGDVHGAWLSGLRAAEDAARALGIAVLPDGRRTGDGVEGKEWLRNSVVLQYPVPSNSQLSGLMTVLSPCGGTDAGPDDC